MICWFSELVFYVSINEGWQCYWFSVKGAVEKAGWRYCGVPAANFDVGGWALRWLSGVLCDMVLGPGGVVFIASWCGRLGSWPAVVIMDGGGSGIYHCLTSGVLLWLGITVCCRYSLNKGNKPTVLTERCKVTDKRTDGQTDRQAQKTVL